MHIHSAVSPKLDRHTWDIAVPVEWSDEHLQDDRRKVPRVLEAAVDLQAPTQTPMTTEKTLVFRVIYQLLLFALNETRDWEARNALFDSAGIDAEWDPNYFADISSARDAMADSSKQANRQSGFWAMLRDGRCLALLQEDGTLHRPGAEPENMMRLYDAAHRDILGASLKVRQLIIAQA
ncbi:hypothetical protein GCM10009700_34640 [Brevibacterium sanguinis]|uniref:TY-Chap2 family putative peptide chaperone n=1 Tax=Brevibacterium sanguinis TaxID=232444 RepID=UPI00336F5615